MSPQSGVPYEKRQPSPELRSFLDPLKPGAYFDCGRARLYGIDEVLEQEAERRGRPVGADHFQLVATDGGLIFCRASITFAIAARWKDVTMSRPVELPGEGRVDLAVVWPNHGELTFTVSRRLASNVFRRWLQFQAQNTRRHQVEQAARYERSQRARPEPESETGGSGRTLAATPMPAPETVQLDEAEREVFRMAVQSGEVGLSPTPMDQGKGVTPARSRADVDVVQVVPAGDMAATTHFDDNAAESASGSLGRAAPRVVEAGDVDLTDDTRRSDTVDASDEDWRNGWTYSDGHDHGTGGDRSDDPDQADFPPGPDAAGRPVDDIERLRRAAADTTIFPDTVRVDSGSVRAGVGTRRRGRLPLGNGSRYSADSSTRVRLGDLPETFQADPDLDRHRAVVREGAKRSRGGYLDGLPATAGDAALASSGAPDRRTRPDSSPDPSSRSVPEHPDVEVARPVPVPQISGARLQSSELRRRNPDGLDIRSVVLTDSEPSVWSDVWHRHRITIMATVSLVALLVIAVSSLLARNGEDDNRGATVDADIAIPPRRIPVETDPVTGADSELTGDPTPLSGSHADGSDGEPNSPMIVDAVGGGAEADGGDTDTMGQPDSGQSGTDQVTATTAVRICHSNYGGCVPVAPDVDCEGDGDGPVFLSEPVVIFGEDVYDLDTDGDRDACEPDQPRADQADT